MIEVTAFSDLRSPSLYRSARPSASRSLCFPSFSFPHYALSTLRGRFARALRFSYAMSCQLCPSVVVSNESDG